MPLPMQQGWSLGPMALCSKQHRRTAANQPPAAVLSSVTSWCPDRPAGSRPCSSASDCIRAGPQVLPRERHHATCVRPPLKCPVQNTTCLQVRCLRGQHWRREVGVEQVHRSCKDAVRLYPGIELGEQNGVGGTELGKLGSLGRLCSQLGQQAKLRAANTWPVRTYKKKHLAG